MVAGIIFLAAAAVWTFALFMQIRAREFAGDLGASLLVILTTSFALLSCALAGVISILDATQ